MRNTLFILTFIIIFVSCKKDSTTEVLYKQWQWQNSVGGFSGYDTISPSPDSVVMLTLKSDMSYTVNLNGKVMVQGAFQISTVNNQKVIKFDKAVSVNKLVIEVYGVTYVITNNALQLTDYGRTEPYTHYFK